MKPIQLLLIGVAFVAAIAAGFIMLNIKPEQVVVQTPDQPQQPQIELARVLVASVDIPMGTELNAERMSWIDWPKDSVRDEFITETKRPEAIEELSSALARVRFFPGEPIREEKLVNGETGYMSAVLPSGKQAVAVRIRADRAAGGFILPEDYVDVVMTFQDEKDVWVSERVLSNVRVLAIDQIIEDEDGRKTILGESATLELTPEQVNTLTIADSESNGRLTLALRSVEDSGDVAGGTRSVSKDVKRENAPVRMIRYGTLETVRNISK